MNEELEVLLTACNDLGLPVLSFVAYSEEYDGPAARVLNEDDTVSDFYYRTDECIWVEV